MSSGEETSVGRPRAALALLLLGFAAVLSLRLDDAPVVRRAEVRVDRVSREMLASGDWLVPRLDGVVRLQKPPLYYWLVALTERAAGGASALALRAPAAVCALLMLLVAWRWGGWVGGPRHGLLAAVLLACLIGVAQFGRLGVAETLLAVTSSAALLAWDRARTTGSAAARWTCVALVSAALLTKATAVLLVVALPILLDLALRGELRRALGRRALGFAALALLPMLLWYAAVLVSVPGAWDELVSVVLLPFGVKLPEAMGSANHVRPFWYHPVALLSLGLPLVALVPLLAVRAVRTRGWRDAPRLRFAALCCAAPLAGFSLLPEKQDHYLLPLLPAWAVLLGDTLLDAAARAAAGARGLRVASVITTVLLLAAAGACVWLLRWGYEAPWPLALPVAAVVAACAAGLLSAAWRGRALRWAGCLATAVLLMMALWFGTFDVARQRRLADVQTPAEQARWDAVVAAHPWLERPPSADPPP
jgi:4-amino-4-deoxy-L-arabinose transferase-like glycosyltransferase